MQTPSWRRERFAMRMETAHLATVAGGLQGGFGGAGRIGTRAAPAERTARGQREKRGRHTGYLRQASASRAAAPHRLDQAARGGVERGNQQILPSPPPHPFF